MATSKASEVLAIDLGGTKILFAVVDEEGRVLDREKAKSSISTSDEIVTQIVTGIEAMRERFPDIRAVGIGVPGTVDSATGDIVTTANLPLSGVPLGRRLTEACGLPVAVGNDVTLCTLGEAWYEAGRSAKHVVGIFVGTGIGGGIVFDGSPYTGAHGAAGEVGHMQLVENGPLCGCGRHGCFEALASRTAIEREIGKAVESGRECVLGANVEAGERLRSSLLKKALKANDPVVTDVMTKAADFMGAGIADVVNLLDPDLVILGGGVIEACGAFVLERIRERANRDMVEVRGGPVPIVESALGDDAGVMGAAAVAREALRQGRPSGPTAYAPQIEWIGQGEVQVNGTRHTSDIVIRADGTVKKRKKKLLRAVRGNKHVLGGDEVRYVCKGNPRTLVVGTGVSESVTVRDDARAWLAKQDIGLVCHPSPQAVTEYRSMHGSRALLLHLRC